MVTKNGMEASQFYKQALAKMQKRQPDIAAAKHLLNSACDLGDPFAAYALGTWHFHGSNGLRKNKKRGVSLWQVAAEAKVPDALFDLAVCYEEGNVLEQDFEKAFLLYLDAAIRGDEQAVFEVARCYSFGIGVQSNSEIAEIWSERAVELGTFQNE